MLLQSSDALHDLQPIFTCRIRNSATQKPFGTAAVCNLCYDYFYGKSGDFVDFGNLLVDFALKLFMKLLLNWQFCSLPVPPFAKFIHFIRSSSYSFCLKTWLRFLFKDTSLNCNCHLPVSPAANSYFFPSNNLIVVA